MSVPEVSAVPEERHRFITFFRQLPRIAGVIGIVVGAVILSGWAFGLPTLYASPGTAGMQPITAITFILTGLALFLAHPADASKWMGTLCRVLAILVGVVTLITGAEYLLNMNLGVDLLVYPLGTIPPTNMSVTPAGRMAINTAAAFMCLAIGLLLLPRDRRSNGIASQIAAFGAIVIAFVALVGYAFGVRDFYSMQEFLGMALVSAMTFVVLGMGLLFSQLHRGLPGLVSDAGAAGVVARRLLPGTIIIPFFFGIVRLTAEEAGLFSSELATSLFAVADIVTFLLLVAWSARVLRVTDRKRAVLFVQERDARMSSEKARHDAETARAEAEEAPAEAELEGRYRERPNVRRLAGSRRRRDEFDDIFAEEGGGATSNRTGVLRPVENGGRGDQVQVHLVIPKNFNDAQQVADQFKRSVPVILNLQTTETELSKRLIDFCAGLTYAMDGGMQRIAEKVFLLTPRNVEVSAEERARLIEKGFFNQS